MKKSFFHLTVITALSIILNTVHTFSQGWNVELLGAYFYDFAESVYELTASDSYAYVALGTDGLSILDISDRYNPFEVGHWDFLGWIVEVAVAGNYAYVSAGDSGLRVLDVSDPTNPFEVGHCYTNAPWGYPCDIEIVGNYAYVIEWDYGLSVMDISDPTAPFEISLCYTGWANGLALQGNYAYISNGEDDQMMIVNISNPFAPTIAGQFSTYGFVCSVAVSGNYAYLANYDYDLQVVDVSNVHEPILISSNPIAGDLIELALIGDCIFATNMQEGLEIFNIGNPPHPIEVGYYDPEGSTIDIAALGVYAYSLSVYPYAPNTVLFSILDCSQAVSFFQAELTIKIRYNDLILNWEPIQYAMEYHIFYQDEPYFEPTGTPQAVISPPDTSWVDVGALSQGKRYYRLVVEY